MPIAKRKIMCYNVDTEERKVQSNEKIKLDGFKTWCEK